MARVPAQFMRALSAAMRGEAAAMRHGADAAREVIGPPLRIVPDVLEVRSARSMPDADFYLWRRGQANKVGRPAPRSARDEWEALPPVEPHPSYWGAMPPRAWGKMNPEHHFGVKVKRPDLVTPELAYRMLQTIYKARQGEFAANSHGTTGLVNITLRDLQRLYGLPMPEKKPERAFRAVMTNAQKYGFAELDLRNALRPRLRNTNG